MIDISNIADMFCMLAHVDRISMTSIVMVTGSDADGENPQRLN